MNLATSCNLVHVLTFYNFSFLFGTYASRNRPCRPVPYGPMQRLCHPAHFFLFCCKSKLFNSKENCKSQIPDSLSFAFHSEQYANAQTTLPLYFSLSGSSAKLHCCRSRETPCQPSGSTRCPLNMTQGSQRKPSGVDQHHKHLVLKLHLYQRTCHNHRRQTTLAIIATKTIELVSQLNLACRNLRARPSI